MRRPKPKTVKVECDVCGQDWAAHKPDAKGVVQLDECVRLLKEELRSAKAYKLPFYAGAASHGGTFIATSPNYPPNTAGI